MKNVVLDSIDMKILRSLQVDSEQSIADLADKVGLSQTPCWKRLKRLESDGVIRGRAVLLDQDKLGLGLTVFVTVRTNRHDPEWLTAFGEGVAALPQVVEFFRLAGEADYLLKVIVQDIAAYDLFYKTLIKVAPLADVSSSFAMERIKWTPALPI